MPIDYQNIASLKTLRESEDRVEFKAATRNFNWNGGKHTDQKERRKCYLGYIVALCNEGGGHLVLGMTDKYPHEVVGTDFALDKIGVLEDAVYTELGVRVHIHELHDEAGLRVLVTQVPSRPKGKTLKFEGIALMRTGESLRNMSDEEVFAILSEQEGDFSAKICRGISLADLDDQAIKVLKTKYAEKQGNDQFLTLSDKQVLTDLDLIKNNQLTYATLILLGKGGVIKKLLPQCAINLEYRDNHSSIQFDKRDIFVGPYFLIIEDLWKTLDARNRIANFQFGAYIVNLPALNNEVIRESVNNAVAHRDYSKTSEIVIKQSPEEFSIYSHGGFPLGVTKDNILTINSTPRNRLLADVMTKTGLVERSGQGVDKIFYQTLSEGKGFPRYDDSDLFQVTLRIPTAAHHPVFSLFVRNIQAGLDRNERIGVHHVLTLVKVHEGLPLTENDEVYLHRLIEIGAVRESNGKLYLGKQYSELEQEHRGDNTQQIIKLVGRLGSAKMADILALFKNRLTRRQVNNIVFKLVDEGRLIKEGEGYATRYSLAAP